MMSNRTGLRKPVHLVLELLSHPLVLTVPGNSLLGPDVCPETHGVHAHGFGMVIGLD